jgi:hypothetical protein
VSVANVVLLVLTAICALAALYFLARGLQARSTQARYPYGVAQQEARHSMQVSLLRAGFLTILTLILLGIFGLVPNEDGAETQATATATATVEPAATVTEPANEPASTPEGPSTASPSPTEVDVTVTVTITATVTGAPTEAPISATATVNSPNGLWLREAPGGAQQLELIAHETVLELLAGREAAGDIDWQQVRTPAGNEGWVAAEFLIYQ